MSDGSVTLWRKGAPQPASLNQPSRSARLWRSKAAGLFQIVVPAASAAANVVCAVRLLAMESTKSAPVKAAGKRFSSIAAMGSPCKESAKATALKMASSRASLLGEYCVSREMR